ncbi:MAG: hypothetical protein JXR76_02680 [Deltaproteobacteria bacterium]|nr:hypothetical protein [Deltaproteobacteria bacterium]
MWLICDYMQRRLFLTVKGDYFELRFFMLTALFFQFLSACSSDEHNATISESPENDTVDSVDESDTVGSSDDSDARLSHVRDADSDGHEDDCDDSDPTVYAYAAIDNDGDGYLGTLDDNDALCIGDEPIENLVPLPHNKWARLELMDCDDNNPELFEHVCIDADNDGYCGSHEDADLLCMGADIPVGYVKYDHHWLWYDDCNDSDNEIQLKRYLDEDSDGIVSYHSTECVSEEASNEKQIRYGLTGDDYDCNDSDAAICQYHPELFGDGVDSNCSKMEYLEGSAYCSQREKNCYTTQVLGSCAGVDIGISSVQATITCSEYASIQLANLGTEQFDSTLQIEYLSRMGEGGFIYDLGVVSYSDQLLSQPFLLDASLAPGQEVSLFFNKTISQICISPVEEEDCDLSNNVAKIPFEQVWCD